MSSSRTFVRLALYVAALAPVTCFSLAVRPVAARAALRGIENGGAVDALPQQQKVSRSTNAKMRQIGGGGPGFNPSDLIGPIILVSLFASGALGWLFNGILFLTLLPLVLGPLISWYIQSNLVEGSCPECGSPAQVLKGQTGGCMYCGASFSDEKSGEVFLRSTMSGQSNPFSSGFGGQKTTTARSDDGVVEVEVLTDKD